MKRAVNSICAGLFCICCTVVTLAQPPAKTTPSVPRLVQFGGALTASNGRLLTGVVGVTFALYEEERGGAPVWMETQNVRADATGHYTATLGSTRNDGVPAEVLASEQGRWLGVQPQGETEEPRVLLVSVPYALKAADSDTLGGKPASAYALAGASISAQPESLSGAAQPAHPETAAPAKATSDAKPSVTSTGTTNFISRFTDASGDIGNSVMYQNGSNIGIGTTTPGQLLTLETGATGYTFLENIYGTVDPLNGATRLEVGNPVSSLMLTAYGSQAPGILKSSAGVVSLAGPFLVGSAGAGDSLYLYAGNAYTAPQFTLTSTGSVGIGTQTPAATLEVRGNAQVDGSIISPGGGGPGTLDTAVGAGALQSNTTGTNNVAIGSNALKLNTAGISNTAVGTGALLANTSSYNTAIGYGALAVTTAGANTAVGNQALASNTSGYANAATGSGALLANTTGYSNTANGSGAVISNTTGNSNTAIGGGALYDNITGSDNVAIGGSALNLNTIGNYNTATGVQALYSNTSGANNTASGYRALYANTGFNNTAVGYQALYSNTSGAFNIAIGPEAMYLNTNGGGNIAIGDQALYSNTQQLSGNIAIGGSALYSNNTGDNNTVIGTAALYNNATGSYNIAIGPNAGANITGNNNIVIASDNFGLAGDNGVIRVGGSGTNSAFIAGIYNSNVSGAAVQVSSSGQLGIAPSSRRYKEDIQDMAAASDGLMRLRPVTFRYKKPFSDGSQPIQYGLIAEEVAEVYPDLVARSADGQIETVKYQLLDPMLLNEVQKQYATISSQKEQIASQEQQIRSLEERMAKLEAALAGTTATAASH